MRDGESVIIFGEYFAEFLYNMRLIYMRVALEMYIGGGWRIRQR